MPVRTNVSQVGTEPFHPAISRARENVDRLGQLPGAPGAAAELAQDAPGLELGAGAFAGGAQPGMSPVGLLPRCGLVPAPVRGADIVLADVTLVAQHDQARGGQRPDDALDPGRGQDMHRAGQRPGHPHDVPVRAGDDLQVHPVLAVLAGVKRPVSGHPVDRD